MQATDMAAPAEAPRRPITHRGDYRVLRPVTARWMDNDVFGHVNNVTYYSFYDTAITSWLMEQALLGFAEGPMWMVVENGCRYISEVAFPDRLTVGLRLGKLGRSSVRWELALFRGDAGEAASEGFYVHVHVDRATRRPLPIPEAMRDVIQRELSHADRT